MDGSSPRQVLEATPSEARGGASGGVVLRGFFLVLGTLALALGILGIFLPLLPTTPLLLVAAACYGRASRRVYDWLLSRSWAGPVIRQWREGRTIPRRAKVIALALVVASFSATFLLVPNCAYGYALLGAIAIGLLIFLGGLRTA